MFCVNCGTKNGDGAKFCNKCGKELVKTDVEIQEKPIDPVCSSCGEKIIQGNKFCIKCGKPVETKPILNTPSPTGTFDGVTQQDRQEQPSYQQTVFPEKNRSNALGVTALVLSIIHFIISIVDILYILTVDILPYGKTAWVTHIIGLPPLLFTGYIIFILGFYSMFKRNSKAGKIGGILSFSIIVLISLIFLPVALLNLPNNF